MNGISLKAYAKINLSLDVLGTLANGYHEVKMIMQSIGLFDKVNIKKNKSGSIKVKTNLSYLPVGPDNLVYKAARLMCDEFGIKDGIFIDLYKYIPVSAGMAGGSTDAAAVLKGMNIMYELGQSDDELMRLGLRLGADVPYCIMGGTALAEGIGEKLTPLDDCPEFYLVIGKPAVSVSTKYVYDNLVLDDTTIHPDTEGIIDALMKKDVTLISEKLCNVLESVTVNRHPEIGRIKETMLEHGAEGSLMSGSGPTVYGIFIDKDKAKECCDYLRESRLVKNSYVTVPVSAGVCRGR